MSLTEHTYINCTHISTEIEELLALVLIFDSATDPFLSDLAQNPD